MEAKNQRLRDQAASFGPARELWTFAEAQLDVYKRLWEAGVVPEAAYEEARQKSHDARLDCGFDPSTPRVDDGAEGTDDVEGGRWWRPVKVNFVMFVLFHSFFFFSFCCHLAIFFFVCRPWPDVGGDNPL